MKAGKNSNKAFFAIILLLLVVLLSVIYFFTSVVRQERQSEEVIQNTKQVVGQLNQLLLKIDTFQHQATDYINSDRQISSTEMQQTIEDISSSLASIRSGGNKEPGLITTIDSIDNAVRKLIYVFNDTIAGGNKTGEALAGINLSITNIRLSVSGILNHKGDYLLQYQQGIKEKGWLMNRRVFIILAVFLLLSIGLIWQLWHNYTLNQKTVKLKLYNNFLVGNIDEAIISTDMDDRILTWNQGATTIFGWEEQEAIGKKRTALLGEDSDIAQFIKTDLKGERIVFKGEVKLKNKAGLVMYIRMTISPVYDEVQRQTGFVSVSMDITTSKIQGQALKEANEQLEVKVAERTGNLLKANKLYRFLSELNKMILRTTDERALYQDICDIAIRYGKFRMAWIGLIDPATGFVIPVMNSGNEQGYLSIIKPISINPDLPEGRGPTGQALREGTYFVCQDIEHDPMVAPWRQEQLSRGYYSSMAVPIKKSGVISGAITVYAPEKNFFNDAEISLMLAAAEDITFALDFLAKEELRVNAEKQLKESEEKFRTLVEKSLAGVYIIQDNVFTYINSRFARIFGYDHPDEIIGKLGIEDLTAPSDLERVRNQISIRLNGTINSVHYTTKARRKDQSFLYIEVAGSLILFKDKPAILGTLFDISYQVEEEIRIGKAVIDAQEKERQQIGMELHDNVKQLLAATQMYLGMINGKLYKEQVEVAGLLDKCREFITDSIQELRKLSHQLAPSTSADTTFEESIGLLVSNMNADKSIDIILNIEPFDPGLINREIQTTLYRILQEQLNNIKKHAGAGEVIISTSLSDDYIFLSIADNGIGFNPAAVREGIGLENIRRRVKFFGGSVRIISAPGKGCEIQVDIPFKPASKENQPHEANRAG